MQAPPGQVPAGMPRPGQMPTPEQIAAMQRQIAIDAEKAGMTVPQFIQSLQQRAREQQAAMQAQQQQQQQQGGGGDGHDHSHPHQHQHQHQPAQGQPQPIQQGQPPNPLALVLAKFLRSQDLKPRTVILNGERKEMFRVKRALRAIESPAYAKLRLKHPDLPEVNDRASLENTFKLLPLSMLALRVEKADPHEGHDHAPKKGKRVKGQWTVRIVPQQDAGDDMYYMWLWEGSQVMRKIYAGLALIALFAIVCYPLWPLKMRQGVYYLSWGFLGLLGLFFLMAIFRVILFVVTYFIVPPGLWLYPNLWEDVSFLDSFRPVWAWHDPNPKKKKKSKGSSGSSMAHATFAGSTGQPLPADATTTATDTQVATAPSARPGKAGYVAPQVEEEDE